MKVGVEGDTSPPVGEGASEDCCVVGTLQLHLLDMYCIETELAQKCCGSERQSFVEQNRRQEARFRASI